MVKSQSKPTLREKRRVAGRLGGLQTFRRYGSEHMSTIGKLGGRPKSPTLEELRQKIAPSSKTKEGAMSSIGSLKELKRLFKLRQKSLR